MSASKAQELGMKPMARWVSSAVSGVDPGVMGYGPVPATRKLLERARLTLDDVGGGMSQEHGKNVLSIRKTGESICVAWVGRRRPSAQSVLGRSREGLHVGRRISRLRRRPRFRVWIQSARGLR